MPFVPAVEFVLGLETWVRVTKIALYPFVTWGFSRDPCGLIVSLDAGRSTVVNAQVEVQLHAGPFLVEIIYRIEYGKKGVV